MDQDIIFRVAFGVIFFTCLFISGAFRRRARATGDVVHRRAESGTLIALRLLVTVPLLLSFLVYLAYPAGMAWAQMALPAWLRGAGVALGLLTIGGAWWVLTSIGRNISETVLTKSDHELITHGPYRWVRHPLYTNGLLLLTALGLMAANAFMLTMVVVCGVAIAVLVVPKEEAELIHRFGDAYRQYRMHTGGLVPRPFHRPATA